MHDGLKFILLGALLEKISKKRKRLERRADSEDEKEQETPKKVH